ncbi:hypothetical protein D3C72_2297780 [compost metagenome]
MDKTDLVFQFAHRFHLVAVNLLGFAGFRIFVGHQSGVVINLRFTIGDNRFAVGRFHRLIR